jgi:protein-tyrosine phosphatase
LNGIYWIHGNASAPLSPPAPVLSMVSPVPLASMPMAPMPLAVVLCPRGGNSLRSELIHLQRAGINTLVSLLTDDQVEMLELADECAIAQHFGMKFLHHPIPDHQLPRNPQAFRAFVSDLANRLHAGERIGIHCWGSIGRATVTAACTLIHLGWPPAEALAAVESARGIPVPDTEEQQEWIMNYKAHA